MKRFAIICSFLSLTWSLSNCKHDPVSLMPIGTLDTNLTPPPTPIDTCYDDTVYFERQLLPIFISNCAMSGCHDATSAADDIVLDSYENIMNSGKITAFDSASSKIFKVISITDPSDRMPQPPNPALSKDQIDKIGLWIEQGALNLFCDACDDFMTFYGEIAPFVYDNCKGCHNDQSNYDAIKNSSYLSFFSGLATSGDDIYYNNLFLTGNDSTNGKNRLIGCLTWEAEFINMPYGASDTLRSCDIDMIRDWVEAGMPQ